MSANLKITLSKKDSIGDVELDTAIMYCGGNTEKILGKRSRKLSYDLRRESL